MDIEALKTVIKPRYKLHGSQKPISLCWLRTFRKRTEPGVHSTALCGTVRELEVIYTNLHRTMKRESSRYADYKRRFDMDVNNGRD